MTTDAFNLTIHMVSSLDGFIASKDNSISWIDTPDHYARGVEGADVAAFLKTIDCYIMGARTYEHALELSKTYGWAYGDTPTVVVTNRNLPLYSPHIELYAGDLNTLVHQRLMPRYKRVWMAGGAALAGDLIRLQLADEIRISVVPVILGEGTRFFNGFIAEQALHLTDVTAYKNGMVELCYEVKKGTKNA